MLQVCGMDPNTDTHKVVENGDRTSEETVPDQPAPDLSILLKKLEDQNRYHSCTRSHLSGPCPRFYLTAIEEYLEEGGLENEAKCVFYRLSTCTNVYNKQL